MSGDDDCEWRLFQRCERVLQMKDRFAQIVCGASRFRALI